MGYAIPAYPHLHLGSVLILGSADCALHDLNRARIHFPNAPVIGINDAAKIARVEHLFSLHCDGLGDWVQEQIEHFSFRPIVHAAERRKKGEERAKYPAVDYWWAGANTGGTSAWSAVRVARMMGFERMILCGCPLEPTGYCVTPRRSDDCRSMGDAAADDPMLKRYRRRIQEYVAEGDGVGVSSMSGWTRELLGAPN